MAVKKAKKTKKIKKENLELKSAIKDTLKSEIKGKTKIKAKTKIKEKAKDASAKKSKKKTEVNKTPNFFLKKSLSNIFIIILILLFAGILIFMKRNIIEDYLYDKKNDLSSLFPDRKELVYDGTDFVTKDYPIFREVIFLGDSYVYLLGSEMCKDVICYAEPGRMVGELKEACDEAVKTRGKYVNIFIGPNDIRYNISVEKFKNDLKELVEKIKNAGKETIVSSYLKSEYTELMNQEYKNSKTVEDYDKAMQEVCKEENVYYFDIKDINDYHTDKMFLEGGKRDIIHFNENFYIKYMNKLYSFLYDIEKRKFDPRRR